MTTLQQIKLEAKTLPKHARKEALDFILFLKMKQQNERVLRFEEDSEEMAIQKVFEGEECIKNGDILTGNIRELVKNIA